MQYSRINVQQVALFYFFFCCFKMLPSPLLCLVIDYVFDDFVYEMMSKADVFFFRLMLHAGVVSLEKIRSRNLVGIVIGFGRLDLLSELRDVGLTASDILQDTGINWKWARFLSMAHVESFRSLRTVWNVSSQPNGPFFAAKHMIGLAGCPTGLAFLRELRNWIPNIHQVEGDIVNCIESAAVNDDLEMLREFKSWGCGQAFAEQVTEIQRRMDGSNGLSTAVIRELCSWPMGR